MSAIIRAAIVFEAESRSRWNDYVMLSYAAAADATNGHMLNARGRAARMDALELWKANGVTQRAYASEELLDYWKTHPVIRFSDWAEGEALYMP